jgi:putative addiction module CopG family antidote
MLFADCRSGLLKGAIMAMLNLVINEQEEALIIQLVDSGQFKGADEVLHAGLRLVEAGQHEDAVREEKMRAAIQAGIDDFAQGRFITLRGEGQISEYVRSLGQRAAERVVSQGD